MKKFRGLLLAGCLLALGACGNFEAHSELEALNEAQSVGSPFTQSLAAEYREYANREMHEMMDYPDALHFARKGLAAAAGETVMPEPLSDWNLTTEHMQELGTARGRLVVAFDTGAREMYPQEAAVAQARFDCWIEQQEENWQADDIANCKNQFMQAMDSLEAKLPKAMTPPQMAEPVAALPENAVPMTPAESMYLVFFDFDSSKIGASGETVLDAVRTELAKHNAHVIRIVGHTDSAGPKSYNDKLAMKRANAVRDSLTGHGVDPSIISVEGRGENELMVQTSDNVREPANRRAQITFE